MTLAFDKYVFSMQSVALMKRLKYYVGHVAGALLQLLLKLHKER